MGAFYNKFHRISAAFTAIILLLTLIGCKDYSADAVIRYEVKKLPLTLDPQLASSPTELTIVANIFEGLYRLDQEGKPVPGVAESHEKSEDGLKYTLKIRKNAKWRGDKDLTAHDFVYAFKRAADPLNKAPLANTLDCIKNMGKILNGEMQLNMLGVTAVEDKLLEIELEYDNPEFLSLLCMPIAMPCNEAYFVDTAGRYGLAADTILTNGSFRVFNWQEKSVKLTAWDDYKGPFKANSAAVVVSIRESDMQETVIQRLVAGEIDCVSITDAEALDAQSAGLKVFNTQNISYVMYINPKIAGDVGKLPRILKGAYNCERFRKNEEALKYLEFADSLIPRSVLLGGAPLREQSSTAYDFSFRPEEMKALLLEEVKNMKDAKVPPITLKYVDVLGIKEIATAVAIDWQESLGVYVNVESAAADSLLKMTETGDFQVVIVPISGADSTAAAFFANFRSGLKTNPLKYFDPTFDKVYDDFIAHQYDSDALTYAQGAERILAQSDNIIPLAFGSTRCAVSSSILDFVYPASGTNIDFAFMHKKS